MAFIKDHALNSVTQEIKFSFVYNYYLTLAAYTELISVDPKVSHKTW